jgi:hypothetical protein
MNAGALCSTGQAGVGSFLYMGDGDTLYAVNFDDEAATFTGGVYSQVFTGGDDRRTKRAKKFLVYGKGTNARAQLVLTLDDSRRIVLELSGVYDTNKGILFYTEFDPSESTYLVATATLRYVEGEGVEIRDMDMKHTWVE